MRRFAYWRDPLCVVGCALYSLNRFALRPHAHDAFLRFYFNDSLLIPCALPLLLWMQRQLGLRTHDLPPEASEVSLYCFVWSILFEVIGPHLIKGTTGDLWDVAAYVVGGLIAWAWWNRASFFGQPA